VACGRKMSINELAAEIIRITGSSSEIRYLPVRAGDVKHSQAAIERFRAVGFEPTFDFAAGLHSTVEQLRAIAH
jgi:UDP-glucose 4-epimerase